MNSVPLDEAQVRLGELIEELHAGEEITITDHGQPVAQLKKVEPIKRKPRQAGNCKGMLVIVADDEEHLKDFAGYME
jgi:prevent-host-death family protein